MSINLTLQQQLQDKMNQHTMEKTRIGTTMNFQVQNVPTARSIDTAGFFV